MEFPEAVVSLLLIHPHTLNHHSLRRTCTYNLFSADETKIEVTLPSPQPVYGSRRYIGCAAKLQVTHQPINLVLPRHSFVARLERGMEEPGSDEFVDGFREEDAADGDEPSQGDAGIPIATNNKKRQDKLIFSSNFTASFRR